MVKVLARNVGLAAAPGTSGVLSPSNGFMIDVVLSTDTNTPASFATFSPNFSEDVLLQGGRISNTTDLAPSTSKDYIGLEGGSGRIPVDTPGGAYFVCARIDSGNKVAESDESNNTSCAQIKISSPTQGKGKPDLIVRLTGPSSATAGSDIGASVKLVAGNTGTGAAAGTVGSLDPSNGYMIDLILSTDLTVPTGFATFSPNFSEDVLLRGGRASRTIDLAASTHQAFPIGAGIPADTPAGSYQLCARIDPGSKVAESNEGNNTHCIPLKIGKP
jgi:hypothetical protein